MKHNLTLLRPLLFAMACLAICAVFTPVAWAESTIRVHVTNKTKHRFDLQRQGSFVWAPGCTNEKWPGMFNVLSLDIYPLGARNNFGHLATLRDENNVVMKARYVDVITGGEVVIRGSLGNSDIPDGVWVEYKPRKQEDYLAYRVRWNKNNDLNSIEADIELLIGYGPLPTIASDLADASKAIDNYQQRAAHAWQKYSWPRARL